MITFENIAKRYGAHTVVDDVSLTVRGGELLGLLGGSGSGKTTTLQMVNRLVEPSAGSIRLGDQDIRNFRPHSLRRAVGYCFQRVGLFGHMSIAENIGITCTLLGWDPKRVERRVDELLELVELDPSQYRNRRPDALSGGQQQRVGVARALAAEPQVILFDEPFGALDPLIRARLQDSLLAIRKRLRFTAMFVTHDVVEAFSLCDRVGVMHGGRLLQVGTPRQLIENPVDDYVAQLVQTPLRQAERVQATFGSQRPAEPVYTPPALLEQEHTLPDGEPAPRRTDDPVWPFGPDDKAI